MKHGETWCIVGGGVLGLTLAHRLASRGRRVTVMEAADQIGGLADAWRVGDVVWDRFYHVILLSDLHTRGLLDEIGLEDSIQWSTTNTDYFTDKHFYPLNNAFDYLRFRPLGLIDKVRLAATILYAARIEDGLPLEQIGVADWLKRLSGRRAYEQVWRPLLRAKLGENHVHASAAFIWAIIRRLYAARRSGMKTEMFGYVDGGYARVFDRFGAVLREEGVECLTGCPVTSVAEAGGRLRVESRLGRRDFDRVVVTSAAPLAGRMIPALDDAERSRLDAIRYQGIICASVLLKQPLNGCYITYIADEGVPYTAVIEMTALIDPRQVDGHTLVYLPWYVPSDDPAFELPDAEIEERFTRALRSMYPKLAADDIVAFRISRARNVLAVATLDYSNRLPPMATSVPGLHIVNSAHIVNGTLNVNETIRLADTAFERLMADESRTDAIDESQTVRVA